MSITKQKFVDLAAKLARETFADFFIERSFTIPEVKNPVTGVVTQPAVTEQVTCVRIDYQARQVDGQVIQVGDFQLIAEVARFQSINPKTNGVRVTVDGIECQIINAQVDAADAAWVLQVRQL